MNPAPAPLSTGSLAAVYPRHLEELQRRTAEALQRGGFDHLVVPSGTLHYQVFDDRDYPYAVNPPFKHWAPLTRNPGSWLVVTPGRRPKIVYLQPRDYWHRRAASTQRRRLPPLPRLHQQRGRKQ